MSKDKSREIIDNYINGNLSDFREQVKKLNKKDLLCLLQDIESMELKDVKEAIYRAYNV